MKSATKKDSATQDIGYLSQGIHLLNSFKQCSDFLDKGRRSTVDNTLETINKLSESLLSVFYSSNYPEEGERGN